MSEGLNYVVLIGNLGADPELRMTQGGTAVLKFRLATTEVYFDKERTKQERTDWHHCVVFGRRAESLSRILAKGMRATVTGRISYSSSEKDGQKRYWTDIVAERIFLSGLTRSNGAMPEVPPAEPPAASLDIPF
jgi:single-strand DNA-binding protein